MAVLELHFLAGRFHATAWGRNVNEGDPEWPPSPFRLARALLDIWYRRYSGEISIEEMTSALSLLAGSPRMAVPPSRTMAVKGYLDQNNARKDNPDKITANKEPVVDAFVVLDRPGSAGWCRHKTSVYVELPDQASASALEVLRRLAPELNFLGRSESWVEAQVLPELPSGLDWQCRPDAADSTSCVQIQCLRKPESYQDLPFLPKIEHSAGEQETALRDCTWLEALALSTTDLQAKGWNRHPLLENCAYTLPPAPRQPAPRRQSTPESLCFTYGLQATVLPSVTQTLVLAERVRRGLMSRSREAEGNAAQLFSGKNAAGQPLIGHRHAFFWPCDLDRDGKIDHVRVLIPAGHELTRPERQALESLRGIWTREEVSDLVLLHVQPLSALSQSCTVVESATPLVFGRHYKKKYRTWQEWVAKEIQRCCTEMGLPAVPQGIACLKEPNDSLTLRWHDFVRSRKDGPPQAAYGFRLTFDKPVRVPFALGSLAHFGMGLFRAGQPDS